MKIRTKLLLGFGWMIALQVTLGLYSYYHSQNTTSAYQEMMGDGDFRTQLISVQYLLTNMSNDERAYLLTKDAQYADGLVSKDQQVRQLFASISSNATLNDSNRSSVSKFIEIYEGYYKASQQLQTKVKAGNVVEAQSAHFNDERQIRKQLDTEIEQLLTSVSAELSSDVADRQAENDQQAMTNSLILALSVLVAVSIGLLLARSITRPLDVVNRQLKIISEGNGDLSREILVKSRDEVAQLASSFNLMVRNLRSILLQAKDTAIQVAASSEQLNASSEQTTRATEQIVEATQMITVSVEKEQENIADTVLAIQQMSDGIQQVSAGNKEVYRLAYSASEAAANGAHAVQDVLREMSGIEGSVQQAAAVIQSLGARSHQINGITSIITDLANRTNLLSLNAAIEAARAAEHGKGFAVVATEIRKLAEQSANSATQIADLIKEIVVETDQAVTAMHAGTEKVKLGLAKTNLVDDVFQSIEANVAAVTEQVEHSSATTTQLAETSKQIVAMVETVSETSNEVAASCQTNSASTEEQLATMEEISSSSQALSRMAEDLHEVLSRFKLQ